MTGRFFKFLFSSIFLVAFSICISAQSSRTDDTKGPDEGDYPKSFKESIQKQRIEREKKDYTDMLARGDEALQLSTQLEKSYAEKNALTAEDLKKLDRMEKLIKKIRTELGAGSDDGDEDLLADKSDSDDEAAAGELKDKNYFQRLQSMSGDLLGKLKETTRFSISVAAIQSSNAVLKLVKFLKLRK